MFKDKVILITGGTGSFGNAVMKRLLKTNIREIRIFSRDEKKQDDMRRKFSNEKLKFYIGDVRDYKSLIGPMKNVDFVFHAAALKQVPSCEFFPIEAVKTNILGTENVLNASIESGVKKVVCLSTDKAAYPINSMGISKAMMEKIFIAKSKTIDPSDTLICGTRYGNVMASRGSVIPLFVNQIINNKELTITNPDMTRFLMDLNEAIDLVFYAFKHAKTGDIMVQKSSASTIEDLALSISELFGVKHKVKIIGTRHGEKLYETLLTKEERMIAIDESKYFRIPTDKRDLNYDNYYVNGKQEINNETYNSHNTKRLNVKEIKEKLLKLDFINDQIKKWKKSQ